MDKVKKYAKYLTNILGIVAALIAGINGVDGITVPYAIQIVEVIAVVQGVIRHIFIRSKDIKIEGEKVYGRRNRKVRCYFFNRNSRVRK